MLQFVIVFIGIAALAFLLWEPQIEGRNLHATLYQIYFNDPFLVYAYTGSIAFFVALYQAFKLLGYMGRDELLSRHSLKALRTIQYSAVTIIGFLAVAVAYLMIVRPGDDIAGGVAMGIMFSFISLVVAAVAAVLRGALQRAMYVNSITG